MGPAYILIPRRRTLLPVPAWAPWLHSPLTTSKMSKKYNHHHMFISALHDNLEMVHILCLPSFIPFNQSFASLSDFLDMFSFLKRGEGNYNKWQEYSLINLAIPWKTLIMVPPTWIHSLYGSLPTWWDFQGKWLHYAFNSFKLNCQHLLAFWLGKPQTLKYWELFCLRYYQIKVNDKTFTFISSAKVSFILTDRDPMFILSSH